MPEYQGRGARNSQRGGKYIITLNKRIDYKVIVVIDLVGESILKRGRFRY
jgi:hypothetical protein